MEASHTIRKINLYVLLEGVIFMINKIFADTEKTLGSNFMLVDVVPVYEYQNKQKTDKISGYRYVVALPEHAFEKIGVKIEGQQLLEKPDKEYPLVEFENLEMTVFFFSERYAITSVATGIRII